MQKQLLKDSFFWGFEGGGAYIAVGMASFVGILLVNQWGFHVLFLVMFLIQISATVVQSTLYFHSKKVINE